jgi:hypothetical protein
MTIDSFSFQTLGWDDIPEEEHTGETGKAYWQIKKMNSIRIRKSGILPGTKQIIGALKDMYCIAWKVKWIRNLKMAAFSNWKKE